MQFYDKCWWVVKNPLRRNIKNNNKKTFVILFWRSIHTYWHIYENSNRLIIFRKSLLFSISPKSLTDYSTVEFLLIQQYYHVKFIFKFFAEKKIKREFWKFLYYVKIENWKDIKAKMFDQKVFQHIVGTCKGQLISKCLFGIFNSPKKRTKKFDFTTVVPQVELFSFIFWEN